MISRKFRYLIALARERHFGRAAARCHVSPSTLSAAIRDLEIELGVPIVERGHQFSGLTAEGRCVVEYAQRVESFSEGLRQELASLRDGLNGQLRLGVIPTGLTVVAGLTSSFARRHPQVSMEVLSLSTDEILARLRRFEIDAGIVYTSSAIDPDLDIVPVWHERHVLLTGAHGPLQERASITWHEAADLPLCLLTPDMQNRKTIDAVFARIGCTVRPTLETNSIVSMLAHVSSGAWSGIVPRSVIDVIGLPQGVRLLALTEPDVDWTTGVVTLAREPRGPMIEALRAEAAGLGATFDGSE